MLQKSHVPGFVWGPVGSLISGEVVGRVLPLFLRGQLSALEASPFCLALLLLDSRAALYTTHRSLGEQTVSVHRRVSLKSHTSQQGNEVRVRVTA